MAAQTCYWDNAAADNDWGAAGNWYTTAEADRVPLTGDTVIFDGRTTGDATGTMDQTGVNLAGFYVMDSYTGTIGATAAPLITECAGDCYIGGSGDTFLQVGNDANDADFANTIINTTGSVELSSQKNANGVNVGDWTYVKVVKGTVTVKGVTSDLGDDSTGTFVQYLLLEPANGRDGNVTVIVEEQCEDYKAPDTMSVYMKGGTLTTYTDIKLGEQYGGTWNVGGTGFTMDADDDNITALNIHGGTFNWYPSVVATSARTTASASPAIATLHVYGGKFSGTSMLETLTTGPTIGTSSIYPGATIDIANGYANFIFTNAINYWGGTVKYSAGQAISLT